MTTTRTLLGTVEIHAAREYPVNPDDNVMTTSVTAMVQPGIYPVYEQDGQVFWEMTGEICYQQSDITFEDIPDMQGAFLVHMPSVKPTGEQITFPSRSFDRADFDDFAANDPLTTPGSSTHRLTFTFRNDDDPEDRWLGWGW